MGIPWRDSAEELARLIREHGQDPERVTDVGNAWLAFCAFIARPIDGLESGADRDADGFVVQWGRYGGEERRPSLTFTRQFAVDVRGTWTETDWYQPEYWQVNLDLVFDDAPDLADLDDLNVHNTGFDFSPPGPDQEKAVGDVEREIRHYPTLRALWTSMPVRSGISMYQAD